MNYTRAIRPVVGESLHRAPVITARLYPRDFDRLQALTASSGESTSGLIRRLVTDEIERHKVLTES